MADSFFLSRAFHVVEDLTWYLVCFGGKNWLVFSEVVTAAKSPASDSSSRVIHLLTPVNGKEAGTNTFTKFIHKKQEISEDFD